MLSRLDQIFAGVKSAGSSIAEVLSHLSPILTLVKAIRNDIQSLKEYIMATELEVKASIDALTAAVAALKPALDAEKAAIADAAAKQKVADEAEKAAFLDTVKAPVDAAVTAISEVTPAPVAPVV